MIIHGSYGFRKQQVNLVGVNQSQTLLLICLPKRCRENGDPSCSFTLIAIRAKPSEGSCQFYGPRIFHVVRKSLRSKKNTYYIPESSKCIKLCRIFTRKNLPILANILHIWKNPGTYRKKPETSIVFHGCFNWMISKSLHKKWLEITISIHSKLDVYGSMYIPRTQPDIFGVLIFFILGVNSSHTPSH